MPVGHGLPLPLHCKLPCSLIGVLSVFELYVLGVRKKCDLALRGARHCANTIYNDTVLSVAIRTQQLHIGKRREKDVSRQAMHQLKSAHSIARTRDGGVFGAPYTMLMKGRDAKKCKAPLYVFSFQSSLQINFSFTIHVSSSQSSSQGR